MSDLLVLRNAVAKPAGSAGSEEDKSEALPGPNPMYGQRNLFVEEEEMKEKFISVGVCAMDTKVGRLYCTGELVAWWNAASQVGTATASYFYYYQEEECQKRA